MTIDPAGPGRPDLTVTRGRYGRLMANRITSISIDCAASRLPARGARPAGIGQGEVRSHVLTDPEGEFCPLRRCVAAA